MSRASTAQRIVRESAPLLAVLVLVQMATGQFLNAQSDALVRLPVLLLLIPVVNGVGGNVGSVLGARLASALHVGLVQPRLGGREMRRNVLSALAVAVVTYVVLVPIILVLERFTALDLHVGPLQVLILLVGSGVLLTVILALLTAVTAVFSFREGWDPDNTVIPVITTIGDLLGVVSLLLVSAWVFE